MFSDEQQSARLRAEVADIDARLTQLRAQPMSDASMQAVDSLSKSWAQLVASMDLPAEVERRRCPHCDGKIMRAATRCMHCWRKSTANGP